MLNTPRARIALLTPLVLLLLPAAALGQASRTWVSGVGDDANPCSRTAPCKTFAGAYTKTAAGGEINALDPGGFGGVTIGHSVNILANGFTAGILTTSGNGITITAGAGDRVTLEGLEFDGQTTSNSGVRVNSAGSVRLVSDEFIGYTQAAVDFEPTNANARLIVDNTAIHDNTGDGVLAAPAAGGSASAALSNDTIDANTCGLVSSSLGFSAASLATNCGTNPSGTAMGRAQINASNVAVRNNATTTGTGVGVLANGSSAGATIGNDVISGNDIGLSALNGASILSLGGNQLSGNTTNGSPTAVDNQAAGPPGPTGPVGPNGRNGASGLSGATGPRGADGRVALVRCRTVTRTVRSHGRRRSVSRQRCTARLVAGPLTFTTTRGARTARAVLSRSGHTAATGTAHLSRAGSRLTLTSAGRLAAGRYRLILTRGRRVLGAETVLVT